jgi:tRNA (guanine9-N1)-methyltransferase
MEIFDPKDLVYLTAEATDVLQDLDPKRVYIIGGIVDHNRLKVL